jgi:hypothetical protein
VSESVREQFENCARSLHREPESAARSELLWRRKTLDEERAVLAAMEGVSTPGFPHAHVRAQELLARGFDVAFQRASIDVYEHEVRELERAFFALPRKTIDRARTRPAPGQRGARPRPRETRTASSRPARDDGSGGDDPPPRRGPRPMPMPILVVTAAQKRSERLGVSHG